MKPTSVVQALAIFAFTSLVRTAPVENNAASINDNNLVEGATIKFCVEFFEHTAYHGNSQRICTKPKECLTSNIAPFTGLSNGC